MYPIIDSIAVNDKLISHVIFCVLIEQISISGLFYKTRCYLNAEYLR